MPDDERSRHELFLARKAENRRTRDHRAFVGPPELYDEAAAMQFDLMIELGLRETDYLLDIGCGSLRAGRLLIPYLLPGRYFGLEPEKWLVEEGIRRELGEQTRRERRPTFDHDADFTLSVFGRSFDFLLAQSVFSHASERQIARCLAEARKVMTPASKFAATFVPGDRDYAGSEWTWCATYRPERIVALADAAGLSCEPIEWPHPTSQRWVLLRPTDGGRPAGT